MTERHPLRSLPKAGDDDDDDDDRDVEKNMIGTSSWTAKKERKAQWQKYNHQAEERAKKISRSSPATVPSLDHTRLQDFDRVYEPSDDTFLLLDGIQYDLFSSLPSSSLSCLGDGDDGDDGNGNDRSNSNSRIDMINRMKCVMEIGTGNGVPITFLLQNLQKYRNQKRTVVPGAESESDDPQTQTQSCSSVTDCAIRAIATDINLSALHLAQRTAQENRIWMDSEIDNNNNSSNITNDIDNVNADNNNNLDSVDDRASHHHQRCKIKLEFVQCDLATPFLSTLQNQIDCLIFNPPYVPTPDSEVVDVTGVSNNNNENDNDNDGDVGVVDDDKMIEASWAGGERGRRVIDRVISQIGTLLSKPNGVAYLVTVDDNDPYELACIFQERHGLLMKPLVRRRARNEFLTIQKITWSVST